MNLVASEIDIREKSLYRDWGSIAPTLIIDVSQEAQDIISIYLDSPWSEKTVQDLRNHKQIRLAHILLACAYLYRNKAIEATEDKVTEQVGPLSETSTERNMDLYRMYERWEILAWKHLLSYITTEEPPVSNPDLLRKMLPTYMERNPLSYKGSLSAISSGSTSNFKNGR